jgi:hypothetical protein
MRGQRAVRLVSNRTAMRRRRPEPVRAKACASRGRAAAQGQLRHGPGRLRFGPRVLNLSGHTHLDGGQQAPSRVCPPACPTARRCVARTHRALRSPAGSDLERRATSDPRPASLKGALCICLRNPEGDIDGSPPWARRRSARACAVPARRDMLVVIAAPTRSLSSRSGGFSTQSR